MALTEEQKTAMNLAAAEMCITGEPWMEEFAARFLAYLPKPDPDAWRIRFKSGSLPDGLLDVHYHATNAIADYRQIDPEATCEPLYTEAPIAHPASEPSEQKPMAWVTTNDDGDYAMLFFDRQEARSYSGDDEPIGLAPVSSIVPQPDYKAQRDAERLDFLDKNRSMNMGWSCGVAPAGNVSITSVICGKLNIREAIDAAIASVKGGE